MRNYVRILKPVLRGVSMDRHLRKNDQVRPLRSRLPDRRNDLSDIPLNVPVSSIDLRDRDSHTDIVRLERAKIRAAASLARRRRANKLSFNIYGIPYMLKSVTTF